QRSLFVDFAGGVRVVTAAPGLLMLVVVAIEAQKLPVAAVRRVVVVVVVLVVDREFPQDFAGEGASAPRAHVGKQGQGLVAVVLLAKGLVPLGVGDHLGLLLRVQPNFSRPHVHFLMASLASLKRELYPIPAR